MTERLPDWCAYVRGSAPIVIVAPHGGRRPRLEEPTARLRLNDLHTADIAELLASRLGAAAIINRGEDRNRLDLNRLSQVLPRAPWFLELLAAEVGRCTSQFGRVELLFVHGWNTGLVQCDLGVGGTETPSGFEIGDGAAMSVRPEYLSGRIGALRQACMRRRIALSLGARYPASHRDNLVQVFAQREPRRPHPALERIASAVADGRVAALQLELGLPLRWPGRWRDEFVDAVVETFVGDDSASGDPRSHRDAAWSRPAAGSPAVAENAADHGAEVERVDRGVTLQLYDPEARIGLSVAGGVGGVGRLLLLLEGGRSALFTGEIPASATPSCLETRHRDDSLAVHFDGPMMLFEPGVDFGDLEDALSRARLLEVHLDLECQTTSLPGAGGVRFGRAEGRFRLGGVENALAAPGFVGTSALRAVSRARQFALTAGIGADGVVCRWRDGESEASWFRATTAPIPEPRVAVLTSPDGVTPTAFTLDSKGERVLRGEVLVRLPLARPTGGSGYLRVNLGVARVQSADLEGYGLYEYGVPVG